MSNAIAFLETIGQDAQLRHSGTEVLEAELVTASIAPEIRAAIIGNDQERLEELLGATPIVCCMVFPEKKEEEEEEEPSKDDDEVSMSLASSLYLASVG
jgi:hypothetical protein